MSTMGHSAELQAIDRIHDPDWKTANAISYRIGISNGLADVIYRLIKAEQKIALLEGDLIAVRNQLYEVKNQTKEYEHDETEQSTSTARNGSGQTRGLRASTSR